LIVFIFKVRNVTLSCCFYLQCWKLLLQSFRFYVLQSILAFLFNFLAVCRNVHLFQGCSLLGCDAVQSGRWLPTFLCFSIPLKCWYPPPRLYGAKFKKTFDPVLTVVTTSWFLDETTGLHQLPHGLHPIGVCRHC
jgi:hypothetical protein